MFSFELVLHFINSYVQVLHLKSFSSWNFQNSSTVSENFSIQVQKKNLLLHSSVRFFLTSYLIVRSQYVGCVGSPHFPQIQVPQLCLFYTREDQTRDVASP